MGNTCSRKCGWVTTFLLSSIGAKLVMALTGLGLSAFLIIHLIGNLNIFSGPEAINDYARNLHANGMLVWGGRGGLLAIFLLHVATAIRLTRLNRCARPVKYSFQATVQASTPSLTMVYTGLLLLAYIIFHIAHFTLRTTDPEIAALGEFDLYQAMVLSFGHVGYVVTYVIAIVVLCLHLSHGMTSVFQTLGLRTPKYAPFIKWIGPGFATIICLGFVSIPVSVMLGIIR